MSHGDRQKYIHKAHVKLLPTLDGRLTAQIFTHTHRDVTLRFQIPRGLSRSSSGSSGLTNQQGRVSVPERRKLL